MSVRASMRIVVLFAAWLSSGDALSVRVAAQTRRTPPGPAGVPAPIDYLTFAQGAVPVAIAGTGAGLGAGYEAAVRSMDGDVAGFTVVDQAPRRWSSARSLAVGRRSRQSSPTTFAASGARRPTGYASPRTDRS